MKHNERKHYPFGGSVAARLIACPGSYFLTKDMPEEEEREEAIEGTKAHECCEWAIAATLWFKIHGDGLNDEKPECWEEFKDVALAYTDAIWKNGLYESITGKSYIIEAEVEIDKNLGMAGSLDFAAIYSDERGRSAGYIADLKYGYNYVEEKKNDQLAFYACGLRETVRRGGKDLDYVRAAIYQPRCGGVPYRETVFSGKALDTWLKRARAAASRIFVDKKPKFKAGDWCKYCRGKAVCKSYQKHAQEAAALELVNIDTVTLPTVEQIPEDQIVKMLLNWDKVEALGKALKAYAMQKCINGGIKGLKLVDGRGKRSWISDEDSVVDTLMEAGLKADDFLESKLFGITKIEPMLKKKATNADEIMKTITKMSSPQVLVEESDPRPAIASNRELLTSINEE